MLQSVSKMTWNTTIWIVISSMTKNFRFTLGCLITFSGSSHVIYIFPGGLKNPLPFHIGADKLQTSSLATTPSSLEEKNSQQGSTRLQFDWELLQQWLQFCNLQSFSFHNHWVAHFSKRFTATTFFWFIYIDEIIIWLYLERTRFEKLFLIVLKWGVLVSIISNKALIIR